MHLTKIEKVGKLFYSLVTQNKPGNKVEQMKIKGTKKKIHSSKKIGALEFK